MAEDYWQRYYKPEAPEKAKATKAGTSRSQFGYSKYMGKVYASLGATAEVVSVVCPVQGFVENNPLLLQAADGERVFYNPLAWWNAQRLAGNEHNRLTQMALDVLSAPASSVDVERAFSFVGSIVSKKRHNLAPYSVQATASLGAYSKAGLVRDGILVLPARGGKGKAKSKLRSEPRTAA